MIQHQAIPGDTTVAFPEASRPIWPAMLNGALGRCPQCGTGKLFAGFLKPHHACSHCGLEFHHHRADDAPPYFVMLIVGHIIVPVVLSVEMAMRPPLWLHLVIWLPLAILMCLALLPPIKGALIGLQWSRRMHGFGTGDPIADPTYVAPDEVR